MGSYAYIKLDKANDYAGLHQALVKVIKQVVELKPGDRRKLAAEMKRRWEELAERYVSTPEDTTAKSDRNYVARYKRGMKVRVTDKGGIEFILDGFDAVAIESGWVPPKGSPGSRSRAEGILPIYGSTWSGHATDMRAYALNPHDPHGFAIGQVKHGTNKQTGESYMYAVVKMPLQQTAQQIADNYKSNITDLFIERAVKAGGSKDYARRKANKRAAMFVTGGMMGRDHVTGLDELKNVGDRVSDALTADMRKEQRKHDKPIYHGITKTTLADGKRKWLFSTFRTITTSDEQTRKRLWYTRGIKPAHILKKHIGEAFIEALAEVMS